MRILTCSILCMFLHCVVHADIYVIVNTENPIKELNKKQTIDIFMARTQSYSSGLRTYAIDQPNTSELREHFYKSLTGKSVAYVNSYWARLFYTGRKRPPADHFKNSEDIIAEVARNKSAIAYVEAESLPENAKVVMVLPIIKEKK